MSRQTEVRPILPESVSPKDLAMNEQGTEGSVRVSPAALARIVEAYDQEDWFEFLDQIDAVSRRRRHRETESERPIDGDRKSMADWIAGRHLIIDRAIREIQFLPTDSTPNEIRLIEVSDRLTGPDKANGQAVEFMFTSQEGPFRVFVVDVNSDELEAIKAGRLSLPAGWKLDKEITQYLRRDAE